MRILGIDYGSRRVGIALSDEEQRFALPKEVLPNDKKLMKAVEDLCIMNEVEKIVVGDSKDFNNEPNKIMEKIVPFVEELRLAVNLPVIMEPEFMTSQHAERFQGMNDLHDASAAALILKSYLDRELAKKEETA